MTTIDPDGLPESRTTTATKERLSATDLELSLIQVTHVRHPGPRGGRPVERDMMVDQEGLKALLDTLPPADRLRFRDGRELACRGLRGGDTVDALVPLVTPDAVHAEFTRRQHRAFCEDMEAMRRASMEAHTVALKNQSDQLKMLGSMADTMQAFMERMTDSMAKREEASESDIVGKVVNGVVEQLAAPGGLASMMGMLRAGARGGVGAG